MQRLNMLAQAWYVRVPPPAACPWLRDTHESKRSVAPSPRTTEGWAEPQRRLDEAVEVLAADMRLGPRRTLGATLEGPMAQVWGWVFGGTIAGYMPTAVRQLAARAQSLSNAAH